MNEEQRLAANEARIEHYLDNDMTPEEQEAFVRDLGEDQLLRDQYENVLFIRGLTDDEMTDGQDVDWHTGEHNHGRPASKPDMLTQPADEHLEMIQAALEKQPALIRRIEYRRALVAAAIVTVISLGVYYLAGRPSRLPVVVVKNPPSPISPDSGAEKAHIVAPIHDSTGTAATPPHHPAPKPTQVTATPVPNYLFAQFYRPYTPGKAPVEVRDYYNDYLDSNYTALISLKPEDIQLAGANHRQTLIMLHVQFLKGLSYLALAQPGQAIPLLDSVINADQDVQALSDAAQWYRTLALLRLGQNESSLTAASELAAHPSAYKQQAAALSDTLKHYLAR